MGVWVHILSDVNTENRTATCAACGPVDILFHKQWVCAENSRRQHRDYMAQCRKNGKALWYKYHITPEQYDAMYIAQDGRCAICKCRKTLVIDHDHNCCPGATSCGKCVRGLLCHQCNSRLGWYEAHTDTITEYALRASVSV